LWFLSEEYIIDDPYSWPQGRSQLVTGINSTIVSLNEYNDWLLYGSHTNHTSSILNDPRQVYLTYEKPCQLSPTDVAIEDGDCLGLNTLFSEYTRDAQELISVNTVNVTFNNSFYENIDWMAGNEILDWLEDSVNMVLSEAEQTINVFATSLAIVFALCFPAIIITYMMLTPLEMRIKEENARTMKMLLMLPISLIDNVPGKIFLFEKNF
jgi:hypothetical protein